MTIKELQKYVETQSEEAFANKILHSGGFAETYYEIEYLSYQNILEKIKEKVPKKSK